MAIPLELDIDAILANISVLDTDTDTANRKVDLPHLTANGTVEMTSTTLPLNPLKGFVKLGDRVHVYTPSSSAPTSDSNDPGLIIMCSWAFAKPRHISKYLEGYQGVYPNSKILLVQNNIHNMLFKPDSWQMPMFNPAAKVVKEYVDSVGDATPRILLQTYSNGGSHSAVQLAESYKTQFATNLPITAFVMDSTPGAPHYWETISALRTSLPKTFFAQLLGSAYIHSVISTTIVMDQTGIAELATKKLYRTLNDPNEAFLNARIPRTYIHSQKDAMILSRDVEAHAEAARSILQEKGGAADGDMVCVEEFIDTPHVNHMASDPERYWNIIRSTWEKAQH